jgi:hypothetical protein
MCEHRPVRAVLFVVFWAWLAVSVTVYGYRLWRRITQGPKSVREARAATEAGRSAALGADTPAEAIDAPATGRDTTGPEAVGAGTTPPAREPAPDRGPWRPSVTDAPTVATALRGIELPCDLVPIVDVDDATADLGRRVVFTTRSSDVRTVATALTSELEGLGYRTSDAPTDTAGNRRRLIATRADATVSVTVSLDDHGTVTAEVTT